MIPGSGVPNIAFAEEHITPSGRTAVSFEPSDCLPQAILTLVHAQVSHALPHTLHISRPPNSEQLGRPTRQQVTQHLVSPGQLVRVVVLGWGPTLPDHHSLVLYPEERDVVVLDEASLELDRPSARVHTEDPKLTQRALDASEAVALRVGEVRAALVEAVDDVVWRGAEGELVERSVRGRVDQGGEERVEVRLVRRVGRVRYTRAPAVHERESVCGS